jgi:hypothetical protein
LHQLSKKNDAGVLMNRREIEHLEAEARSLFAKPREQTALNLIRMINQVNPTGRDLDRGTERRLYELKSRLQSLLINRFPEEIEVREDAGIGEDFVLLWHRPLGRDACHASISGLDDDARFWVRRYLDEKAGAKPEIVNFSEVRTRSSATLQKDKTKPDDDIPEWQAVSHHISVGRDAIRDYEYDRALESLIQALKMSKGDVEAALPLLTLLVETLGSFQEALDLEGQLSTTTLRDERIKLLLGISASCISDFERAEQFLLGVEDPSCAEIYLKMARETVERNEEQRAERYLKLAQGLKKNVALTDAEVILQKLNQLKAQRLKPLEDELVKAHESGNSERTKSLLQSLLAEYPTSTIGRLVREELEETERSKLRDRILSDIDSARQKSDRKREIEALSSLISNGFDRSGESQKRINELKTQQSLSAVAEITQSIKSKLNSPNSTDALSDFLALDFSLQDQVSRQLSHPLINQAKTLKVSDSQPKTKIYVASLLEFSRIQGESATDDYDPGEILKSLRELQSILGTLPDFRSFFSRIEIEAREKRQRIATEQLTKVEELLRLNDPANALTGIERIVVGDLSPPQVTRLNLLRDQCNEILERKALLQTFTEHQAGGQLLQARAIARKILDSTKDNVDNERWQILISELSENIEREWRIQVFKGAPPTDFFVQFFDDVTIEAPYPCLDLSGETFLLATAWFEWIFLAVIDVAKSTVVETCALKAPAAFEVDAFFFDGKIAVIYGTKGEVLRLNRYPKWSIDLFSTFATNFINDNVMERVFGEPSGKYVWLHVRRRPSDRVGWEDDLFIIDAEREQLVRTKPNAFSVHNLLDGEKSRFMIGKFPVENLEVVSPRGISEANAMFDKRHALGQAILHPTTNDIVLAHHCDEPEDNDPLGSLIHVSTWVKDGLREAIVMKNSDGYRNYWVTTSKETGLVYLHYLKEDDLGYHLAALKPDGLSFKPIWSKPTLEALECCVSVDSQHCVFFYGCDDGVKVLQLREDESNLIPTDRKDLRYCHADFPSFSLSYSWCERIQGPLKSKSLALVAMHKDLSLPALRVWIDRKKEEHASASDMLYEIYLSLKYHTAAAQAGIPDAFLDWLIGQYSSHAMLKYELALRAMKSNDFLACRGAIENIPVEKFDASVRRHVCHMLGVAQYMMNDFEKAYATWQSGETWADLDEDDTQECGLQGYLLFKEFSQKSKPNFPQAPSREPSNLLEYLEAILGIDCLIREEKTAEAWELLSHIGPLLRFNAQIDARFVHCLLSLDENPEKEAVDRLAHTYFLARFCGGFESERKKGIAPLPPPLESWSSERIEKLFERARLSLNQKT